MLSINEMILRGTRVQLVHWREECAKAEQLLDFPRLALCRRHAEHCSAIVAHMEGRVRH